MEAEKQESQLNEPSNAPAALADLPVTDEQAQQVAGGPGEFSLNYAKIEFEYKPQKSE